LGEEPKVRQALLTASLFLFPDSFTGLARIMRQFFAQS
jgi:hypothetical protein